MRKRVIGAVLAAAAVLVFRAGPCLAFDATYLDGSPVPGGPKAVEAAPGVSLGVVLSPPGEPPGAPLVLEIALEQPGEPQTPAVRWQAAAYAGSPVRLTWEFAYPFEVQAGMWTMRVSQNGRELVSAAFEVTHAPGGAPGAPGRTDTAPELTPAMTQAPQPPAPQGGKTPAAPQVNGKPAKPGQSVQASPPASADRQPLPTSAAQDPTSARPVRETTPGAPVPAAQPAQAGHAGNESRPSAAPGRAARPDVPEPGKSPPRAVSVIGGDPARRVYAVLAGTYSEEARALWVASFLKEKGARACLRKKVKEGRTLYAVVAGWRDTREDAANLKRSVEDAAPGSLVVPFTAGELESGLSCR